MPVSCAQQDMSFKKSVTKESSNESIVRPFNVSLEPFNNRQKRATVKLNNFSIGKKNKSNEPKQEKEIKKLFSSEKDLQNTQLEELEGFFDELIDRSVGEDPKRQVIRKDFMLLKKAIFSRFSTLKS